MDSTMKGYSLILQLLFDLNVTCCRILDFQREEFGEVYVCHVFASSTELACVVVCDKQYPYRIGFDIATKVLSDFAKRYPESQLTEDPKETPFPQLQVHVI